MSDTEFWHAFADEKLEELVHDA
jgi:hypothetical protein